MAVVDVVGAIVAVDIVGAVVAVDIVAAVVIAVCQAKSMTRLFPAMHAPTHGSTVQTLSESLYAPCTANSSYHTAFTALAPHPQHPFLLAAAHDATEAICLFDARAMHEPLTVIGLPSLRKVMPNRHSKILAVACLSLCPCLYRLSVCFSPLSASLFGLVVSVVRLFSLSLSLVCLMVSAVCFLSTVFFLPFPFATFTPGITVSFQFCLPKEAPWACLYGETWRPSWHLFLDC